MFARPDRPPAGRRQGVVAVYVAVALVALMGILALGLDGGLMQDNRRRAQAAADAAALAGATEQFSNYPAILTSISTPGAAVMDPGGAAATAAMTSASRHGYANDGTESTVTVNVPPSTGPFAPANQSPAELSRVAGYIEVVITYNQPRYFSSIWGRSRIPVAARAVARGRWGGSGNGVIVLNPSASYALDASGQGRVRLTGGAAMVTNSNNITAVRQTGGGSALAATNYRITGGSTGTLSGIDSSGQPSNTSSPVEYGSPPIPDPLAYLPTPSVPANGTMTTENLGNGNKRYRLSPGRYTNMPQLSAGDELIFQQASATSSGIYYIDGNGFKSTGGTIKMDPEAVTQPVGGVMIYNNPNGTQQSQAIQITGNSSGTVNLSALTSGTYAGILLFQNRSSTVSMSVSGNGSFSMIGTFYAASAQLQISGQGTAVIGSQYVSDTLNLTGGGDVEIRYRDDATARVREVYLAQ